VEAGDVPRVETARLVLRPFVAGDLDGYFAMTGDPETMRYVGEGVQSREEAELSLAFVRDHWVRQGFGLWAAEEKASGALVGRIGLLRPDGWPGLEVGWLVARSRWGEGFATEGGRASLDWGFEHLDAKQILSLIVPANVASIRVAEKLGERFDRTLDFHGRQVSVYAIERETWENRGGARA
jgi:RimJ/RimL family protein N-acetyltransferase